MLNRTDRWIMAGGLLLAASTLPLQAIAQDLPPVPRAADTERATPIVPGAGFSGPTAPQVGTQLNPPEYVNDGECFDCTTEEMSAFRRWRMRHKAKKQDKLLGYPEEFIRPQQGSATRVHMEAQKLNARISRLALYNYDFVPGSDELKPRGRQQLNKIATLLVNTPGDVMIEPSDEGGELDEARRTRVWSELSQGPFALAPANIRTGRTAAAGLDPRSARSIQTNREAQTLSRGSSSPSGGSTNGASSAGSGSGTGNSGATSAIPSSNNQ